MFNHTVEVNIYELIRQFISFNFVPFVIIVTLGKKKIILQDLTNQSRIRLHGNANLWTLMDSYSHGPGKRKKRRK